MSSNQTSITTRRLVGIAAAATLVVTGTMTAVAAEVGLLDTAGQPVEETRFAPSQEPAMAAAVAPGRRVTFYPAFEFRPRGTSTLTPDAGRGCVHGNGDLLTTEVLLPDGATITAITLYARPSAGSVSGYLSRFNTDTFPGSGPLLTDLFGAITSGTGDQVVRDDTPSVPAQALVDTERNNYVLQVFSDAVGEWFCGMQVEWTPPAGEVFHAVVPCTVYDLRPGQGGRQANLAPREVVTVDVIQTNYASQGGASGNCGLPVLTEDIRSLELSVNVHGATASGGVRVWPNGATAPTAQAMVISRGARGSVNLGVDVGSSQSIKVRNNTSGFMALELVVTGYYTAPE